MMLSSRAVDRAVAPLLHPDDERARRHTTPPRKNQEAYSPRPPIQEKIPGHCSRHADFAHPLTCGVLAGEQCGLASVPRLADEHPVPPYRRRPADVLATVEIVLRDLGLTRVYLCACPIVGVISVSSIV